MSTVPKPNTQIRSGWYRAGRIQSTITTFPTPLSITFLGQGQEWGPTHELALPVSCGGGARSGALMISSPKASWTAEKEKKKQPSIPPSKHAKRIASKRQPTILNLTGTDLHSTQPCGSLMLSYARSEAIAYNPSISIEIHPPNDHYRLVA
ncbi:hypothetical protein BS47DRAFT_1384765 [Hydnum rufescens UP504]|uniref:Uncharacterized protein n=1 Tax=Hydnum rufescens UP504 TaxID=1448309 RepID=A0A9P6AM44_9AGAM|nr:hypothetical protein BS47DRAFT_1384765 [Hydnum rufescens UP504]